MLLYPVSGEEVVYFCPIPVKAPLGFEGYRDDDEVVAARLLQFDFTEFLHIDIHGGPRDACSVLHVRCCASLTAQKVQGEPVIVGPRKSMRLQNSGIKEGVGLAAAGVKYQTHTARFGFSLNCLAGSSRPITFMRSCLAVFRPMT